MLINHNSKMVWQSAASAAALIVFLCSLTALFDIALFNAKDLDIMLLPLETALLFLCAALLTGFVIFGQWRAHFTLLCVSFVLFCLVTWFKATATATLFSDFMLIEMLCWLLLFAGWLLWHLPKQGKLLMLFINVCLFLLSLWLIFADEYFVAQSDSLTPFAVLNSAILLSLTSLANMAFMLSYPKRLHIDWRSVGFLLSIFIAMSVLFIWFDNSHKLQQSNEVNATRVPIKLQQHIDQMVQTQQQLLARMARRAVVLENNFNAVYFQTEAKSYLNDFPYIKALAVSDIATVDIFAAAGSSAEELNFIRYLKQRLPTLSKIFQPTSETPFFFIEHNENSERSILYAVVRHTEHDSVRLVAASIDYNEALNESLNGIFLDDYFVRISQNSGANVLFESSDYPDKCYYNPPFTLRLQDNIRWQGLSCSHVQTLPAALVISAHIILYAGFLAVLLAVLLQQLHHKSRRQHARLLKTNLKLRKSINEQQLLELSYQQIMDNSADVICTVDKHGVFLELSASAEAVFGHPYDDLLGHHFSEFVHPMDIDVTAQEVDKISAGKITLNFRNRYIQKDGGIVHLIWSSRYVSEAGVLHAIAHDVTELVRQEALQVAQQQILKLISTDQPIAAIFNAICEMAQDYSRGLKATMFELQHDRLQLIAAAGFHEKFLHFFSEIKLSQTTLPCARAVHEQKLIVCEEFDTATYSTAVQKIMADEGVKSCWTIPIVKHGGGVLGTFALYAENSIHPSEDEHELMLLCSQLAAIAIEHMQQQHALQASEQRYRSLYDLNPDPVYIIDLDGYFKSMNKAGVLLLELHEEQIVGQHYSRLILPALLAEVEGHFAAAVNGNSQQYETTVQVPGRSAIDFQITNLPMVVNDQVVAVFGIAKDITERNKTAFALEQSIMRMSAQSAGLQSLNSCAADIHSEWDNAQTLEFVVGELQQILHCQQVAILLTDQYFADTASWYSTSVMPMTELEENKIREALHVLTASRQKSFILTQPMPSAEQGGATASELQVFLKQFSLAASPIVDRENKMRGWLFALNSSAQAFNQDDLLLTQQFTKLLFSALEYRQLLLTMQIAEQQLQRELQFNTAVTNSMTDMLLVTDLSGHISFLNPSAQRLLRMIGVPDFQQPIDQVFALTPAAWQLGCEYDTEVELPILQKQHAFTVKTTPLINHNEQVGWLLTLHDISAERTADAITKERNQFFTLSLELFCLVDLNGCFVQVNPAFSNTLEFAAQELIGHPYMNVIDQKDHQLINDTVAKLRQGQDVNDLEFRVITKTGRLCWLQLSAALEDDIIFCAARDITARKAAEKQLEQTVLELKRSNAELNEFAYVASHDLQEPLRKIRTFGDRLVQKVQQTDPVLEDYVNRMTNAASRMQSLISDLLAYSRLNAADFEFKTITMSALVEDVISMFDEVITQTGAQITTQVQADIYGDARQIRQLLQNLLSNALKFHKMGQPPQIAIIIQKTAEGIQLSMTDRGIGFEPQFTEKIFNPFQRLHGRSEYAGSGIGLSIVKKIAERHSALLQVKAHLGEGACFTLIFPEQHVSDRQSPALLS